MIAHLRRYARPELASALATAGGIADDGYDWTLNDAGGAPGPAREGWRRWTPW